MHLLLALFLYNALVYTSSAETLYKAIYWDAWPYVIKDKNTGKITGIIPDIVSRTRFFCGMLPGYKELIEYSKGIYSANDMFQLYLSDTPYGQGELTNFTAPSTIWIPYLKILDDADIERFYERNSTYFVIDRIREMVVIESDWKISLQYKFMMGKWFRKTTFMVAYRFTLLQARSN